MATRISSLLWILALFIVAMLAGGAVASHLQNLEARTLQDWRQKLTAAGNEKASETASYLEAQQGILQEINQADVLRQFMRQAARQDTSSTADITRKLDEIANLKYGLNHTYLFGTGSELLTRQPEARTLPLKVREDLDLAYRTGLRSYMFFSNFENKTWFVASRRAQSGERNLGYSAFMLEASAAMDPLRNSVFKWRELDFNLARRSGDDNVFIVNWTGELPTTKMYNIRETNIPLFSGTANTFQAVRLNDGEKRLMYISSVPTFPFWQHLTSIPVKTAMADVRNTRMFYLFGLGVFLLFVFALMLGLLRRIIDPSLPIIPETITGLKNSALPKPASAATARKPSSQQGQAKPGFLEKIKSGVSPKGLMGSIRSMMPWASRELSDEEKARLRQEGDVDQKKPSAESPAHPQPEKFDSGTPKKAGPEVRTPTPEELAEQQRLEQQKAEQQKVKQIHDCLQNERLRLHFQPIMATDTKEKVMFETLLRLVDEKGDLMQPGEFFPLAIKHGFVDQVDDMVIVASLRRHMEILTQGKTHMLSINLSYGAFNSMNFMNTFKAGLKSGKLKPKLLNFEVSSREIIEDESAMKFVREMQKSGAKFSVDFFGDPEKTVQAAKKLKFDYMKVDCLKFKGLADGDAKQVEKFKAVVEAGKANNLPLIAEKIEAKSVMWLCEKLGVEFVQGFYLAEPSPKLSLGW